MTDIASRILVTVSVVTKTYNQTDLLVYSFNASHALDLTLTA